MIIIKIKTGFKNKAFPMVLEIPTFHIGSNFQDVIWTIAFLGIREVVVRCSAIKAFLKFCKTHGKAPVPESLF